MNTKAFISSDLYLNTSAYTMRYFCFLVLFLVLFSLKNQAFAGTYIFAGEVNGVDIITHPAGYTGSGGQLTIGVCIDSTSANAADMVIPVQNMVRTFNKLQATSPNVFTGAANNIPFSAIDFESVALHELGHCLSMAHPNLGNGSSAATNYTSTTDGADNIINQGPGTDTIIGSKDDLRGDDVNLHWFNRITNNPCAIDNTVVDSSSFGRATADLPGTDNFAANADRDVCAALGANDSEAVMQQLSFNDEVQRRLGQDDVSTMKLGMSGLDEIAGTADDYTFNVVPHGMVLNPSANTDCDIIVDFDNANTTFAQCNVGGSFLGGNHLAITTANMYFNTGTNWYFNNVLDDNIFCGGGPLIQGTDLNLNNQTITDERRFEATQTITAGTAYQVDTAGCLSLSAATKIILEPGFSVNTGALFKASIQ